MLNTRRFQDAIDAASAAGGGTVVVPPGLWEVGALVLKDHVTLHLEAGAVLAGSTDEGDYPEVLGRWEGLTQPAHAPLLGAWGAQNIAVTGQGTIDGRGRVWWERFRGKTLSLPRPRLVAFTDCRNVLLEGVTLVDSPSWTVNPVRCDDVRITGLTIRSPADSPNTDGINPDSCRRVRISDCLISVGDDCITLKAGVESEDPALHQSCEDIVISNCLLEAGHGGIVIGSEMSGGIRRVSVSNCVFHGTDRGFRMKSRRGRGGVVEDIRLSNLVMSEVSVPFSFNLYYHCNGGRGVAEVADRNARAVGPGTPTFRRIAVSGVTATGAGPAAAFLFGLPESPVADVSFRDISVTLSERPSPGYADMADDLPLMDRVGFYARHVQGLVLEGVSIHGQQGAAFDVE